MYGNQVSVIDSKKEISSGKECCLALKVECGRKAKIFTKTLFMAVPMTILRSMSEIQAFIDGLITTSLGTKYFATYTVIYAAKSMLIRVSSSPLFYVSTEVGNLYKDKKYKEIGNIIQQGCVMSIVLAIPPVAIMPFMKYILKLFGQNEQVANISQSFFYPYIGAVFPLFLRLNMQNLFYGTKNIWWPFVPSVFGTVVYGVTAFLLAEGNLGLPKLGIQGLAYASILGNVVNLLIINMPVLFCRSKYRKFALFSCHSNKIKTFFKLLLKGLPISITMISEYGAFFFATMMLGNMGMEQLQAEQVVSRYQFLFMIPIVALWKVANINISNSKELADVRSYGNITVIIGMGISLIYVGAVALFPELFASVFVSPSSTAGKEIMPILDYLLPITAMNEFFDLIRQVTTGANQGLKDMFVPMLINFGGVWFIGMPLAYVLGYVAEMGILGVNLGIGIGFLTNAIASSIRWFWNTKSVSSDKSCSCLRARQTFFSQQRNKSIKSSKEKSINVVSREITEKTPIVSRDSDKNIKKLKNSWCSIL